MQASLLAVRLNGGRHINTDRTGGAAAPPLQPHHTGSRQCPACSNPGQQPSLQHKQARATTHAARHAATTHCKPCRAACVHHPDGRQARRDMHTTAATHPCPGPLRVHTPVFVPRSNSHRGWTQGRWHPHPHVRLQAQQSGGRASQPQVTAPDARAPQVRTAADHFCCRRCCSVPDTTRARHSTPADTVTARPPPMCMLSRATAVALLVQQPLLTHCRAGQLSMHA